MVQESQLWEYDILGDTWITEGLAPVPGIATFRIHGVGVDSLNQCFSFAERIPSLYLASFCRKPSLASPLRRR